MKITQEQLKNMIQEELDSLMLEEIPEDPDGDGVQGTSFPTDVPFVDYEEAKDDSDGRWGKPIATLPRLWKENGEKPVFFMTKIRDTEYPSVYTRWKPNNKDAWHYMNMGVQLIWADSRYGIGNWSPKSMVSINRHNKRMRKDPYYNYAPGSSADRDSWE